MTTRVPGQASWNVTERAEATEEYRKLISTMQEDSLSRDDVVLSMKRLLNMEIYELDHFRTKGWTPGMMVAVCRENIWGATVDGCTVRVFID